MNKIIGIYKITSPSGKIYIGQSIDIYIRWKSYEKMNCKKQTKLYNSFNCYGVNTHTFEIIEECAIEILNERERFWQDFYNVLNKDKGLNLRLTESSDKGCIIAEETRKKMSNIKKGKPAHNKGKKGKTPANKGIPMSEEQKLKQSYIMKKKYENGDITIWNKGIPMREEVKNKLIEAKKGQIPWNKGVKSSDDCRKKQSESKINLYKRGHINPKSKKVIDLENGFIYDSATQAMKYNKEKINTILTVFTRKLSGERKNNTKFKYI
jgi:group I intron endonuclease